MTDNTEQVFDLNDALSSAYDEIQNPKTEESSSKNEQPSTEQKVEEKEQTPDQGNDEGSKPANEQPLTAPERWSAERKAQFAALPREAQQILLDRESETDKAFTQKSQELSEKSKRYDAFEQILEPRRQALIRDYGSEANAVNQLLQISDYASSDPAGFIKWFADQRGLNLGNLVPANAKGQSQPPSADEEYVDPALQEARQQIQNIQQELNFQKQAQFNAAKETATKEIASFQAAKDEGGNPKYPYFAKEFEHSEKVSKLMGSYFEKGMCKSLEHAYEMAIWAIPETKALELEKRDKAAEAKRLEAAKEAAAKAAKATGIQVKSKSGVPASKAKGNWESDLDAIFDEVAGSV